MTDQPPFTVPFGEQIAFLRDKIRLATETWRDIEGTMHDRAFVVAGVQRDAVLAELQQAIEKAIREGTTLSQFRDDFDTIVSEHGWIGGAGEDDPAWRAKVIFETNLRTSYMAGRLAQLRDPNVLRLRPYWAYRHADTRVPLVPRPEHVAWDGLVLRHDDPWWRTHFPPNGWGCSCGVRPLSQREMERHQRARGKLEAVDVAPPDDPRPVRDPKTGETVMVPVGIDLGWDHQPGATWERARSFAYNPDEPRVAAGHLEGGRWTKDGAGTPSAKDAKAGDEVKEIGSDDAAADEIASVIEATLHDDTHGEFTHIGLRVDDLDPGSIRAGEMLPKSRVWVDGEPTSELLDGTSAIWIPTSSGSSPDSRKASIRHAMGLLGLERDAAQGYFGRAVTLIGGERSHSGEDEMETVILDARPIAGFARRGDMGAIVARNFAEPHSRVVVVHRARALAVFQRAGSRGPIVRSLSRLAAR